MKKQYSKPFISIESFQLNAAVAGSCADNNAIAIGHYEETCGYGDSTEGFSWRYFNEDGCDINLTDGDGDGNDGNCYHGPVEAFGVTFVWS